MASNPQPGESVDITTTGAWSALTELDRPAHLRDLFAGDPARAERFVVTAGDLRIDYSKQRIDDDVLAALFAVAEAAGVEPRRDAMFGGEAINVTENRAVLHTALRAARDADIGPMAPAWVGSPSASGAVRGSAPPVSGSAP
jgi:glucose-6-phosphate isomerase